MVRDALANQERGKVLGEVVAIMEKEVIGLQALDPKSCLQSSLMTNLRCVDGAQ